MSTDIITINSEKEANHISIVCSTTNTGFSSSREPLLDTPSDQQIENIESKFIDKFDDITYYFDNNQPNGLDPNVVIVGG